MSLDSSTTNFQWKFFAIGLATGIGTSIVAYKLQQYFEKDRNNVNGEVFARFPQNQRPRILSSSSDSLPQGGHNTDSETGGREVLPSQPDEQHTLLQRSSPLDPDNDQANQDVVEAPQANQSLLHLLFQVAEGQAQREGAVHRSISCNSCRTSPICGVRYMCANCTDFDVCERCEPTVNHIMTHTFVQIKRPLPPLSSPRSILFKPLYPGREHNFDKLTYDEINTLKSSSHFDQAEIEGLFEQFHSLATTQEGITREVYNKCLGLLGLEKNLVVDSLFKFYDADGDGFINFTEFIAGLSVLVKGSWDEKINFAFKGYDIENKESISKDNLRQMFKAYFQITIALVRDVVRACEEEMMANFDDSQGRPVSAYFNAPIQSDSATQPFVQNGKLPLPPNPGTKEDMWPVMETMSQDAIEELVENVYKFGKLKPDERITFEQFKELAIIDNSLVAWFEAIGTVF